MHNAPRLMSQWVVALAVFLTTVLALSAPPAAAEPWPQRTVRIIVPISAGSGFDVAARMLARIMQRMLADVV